MLNTDRMTLATDIPESRTTFALTRGGKTVTYTEDGENRIRVEYTPGKGPMFYSRQAARAHYALRQKRGWVKLLVPMFVGHALIRPSSTAA